MSKAPSLSELMSELQAACQSHEWERAQQLDEQVKGKISHLMSLVKTDEQKAQLSQWLKKVQHLYDLIIEDSESHRDEIANELKKLTRDKKAMNSYLDSAGY